MTSSLLLAAAAYCFALAAFHMMFWRLFGWPTSLAGSGTLNVSVTQTLNVMLTLGVVMYGAALCWGALFLGVRTVVQPFQFAMRDTSAQILTVAFVAGAAVHAAAALSLWNLGRPFAG